MPQSTTVVNGCDCYISMTDGAGSGYEISGSSNTVQLLFSKTTQTYRRAGSSSPTRHYLDRDLIISLTILYSTASNEALDLLRDWMKADITGDDSRRLFIYIPDTSAGSDYYIVSALMTTLDIPVSASDATPITVSATLESTGAYTHATV